MDEIPTDDDIYEMLEELREAPDSLQEETLILHKGTIYRLTITRDDDHN